MTTLTLNRRRINLDPVNYAQALKKLGMPLSINEQKLHDDLLKVESDSFWGIAIRDSFVDYSDAKFRELVAELLSQLYDSPDLMYRILGKAAYDSLIKLRP